MLCVSPSLPRFSHLALHCLGPAPPRLLLLSLQTNLSSPLLSLDPHPSLTSLASSLALPSPHLLSIPLSPGHLEARLLLPPQSREDSQVSLQPVLLLLPTDPGLQEATSRWRVDLASLLSARLGAMVLQVDGRGSGGRGEAWREGLRGELARRDLQDQIHALR